MNNDCDKHSYKRCENCKQCPNFNELEKLCMLDPEYETELNARNWERKREAAEWEESEEVENGEG